MWLHLGRQKKMRGNVTLNDYIISFFWSMVLVPTDILFKENFPHPPIDFDLCTYKLHHAFISTFLSAIISTLTLRASGVQSTPETLQSIKRTVTSKVISKLNLSFMFVLSKLFHY